MHWFFAQLRKIREEVKIAKDLIQPEVEKRRKELAENAGKPTRRYWIVDWLTSSAKGPDFNYVDAELSLSVATIHTTSNTSGSTTRPILSHYSSDTSIKNLELVPDAF